ncbi:unnamed protein product [Phytophthora fragariaefolia]|uniref:Unnamed protein product n=1 Tax=Phytophthora fragariaefolia TaxID=1490495 RepID=A0A9W6UB83_9STRA|nr:unnamed protein product [Phytophthora fragariaefolia]
MTKIVYLYRIGQNEFRFFISSPIFTSPIYNPAFYLTLDANGYLTYDYAQTLYLSKNDYRLTYITGITQGTATQGIALVPGTNNDIIGLGAISCSSLTVGGSTVIAPPRYVVGITPGVAANNKALVLGASGQIGTISSITATSITGTLQTSAQTNITSVGTLSGLTNAGNLVFSGASRTITGLSSISATTLTGTLSTASQTNITSVGTLESLVVSGNGSFGSLIIGSTPISLKNSSGSDAILQGIAMLSSSATDTESYTPGASITSQRSTSGGSAAHELLFNVKSGSSSTGACAEALRIRYDLRVISKGGLEINPPTSQTLGTVSATNPLFWSGGSSRNFGWRLINNDSISMLSYSYGGTYNDQITWNHKGGAPICSISGFDNMRMINDNGNTMLYINNSNRFGINNTSPEATLHVGGTLVANSEIYTKGNSSANTSYRGNWSSANYWGSGSDAIGL